MASTVTKDRKIYRIWDKANSVWNRLNFLTNANSVDAADGKTLQTKVGAINGITSDLSGNSDNIAASIKCVKSLNDSLGMKLRINNGTPEWSARGADTWSPFSGSFTSEFIFGKNSFTADKNYSNVTLFWYTANNGSVVSSPTYSYNGAGTATLIKSGLYSNQTTSYCMVNIKNMKANETVSFSPAYEGGNIGVIKN